MSEGIDVSKWQGNIDWQKVKNSGIEFAILQEGYGQNGLDTYFRQNVQNANQAGVPIGAYHYSYAKSAREAKEEAKSCLNNIKGYQFQYPICFDIEDPSQQTLGKRTITDMIFAFCQELENNGYYAMVYCNAYWYNAFMYGEEVSKKFDMWIASWGSTPPSISCGIWQKSDSGTISGISGNVDLDVAYKNYPQIMKSAGLNGFSKEDQNSNPTTPTPVEPVQKTYTVKSGDTLWAIAVKYLGNGTRYREIMKLNSLTSETIFPGQILKIPT